MAPFSWSRWLRSLGRPRVNPLRHRRRRVAPALEHLEDRLAPATFTWTGLGPNPDWSTAKNWLSNGVVATPPTNGSADLVFPASPLGGQFATHNDFPVFTGGGAVFNSLTFSGSNYTVTGNQLTLGDPSKPGSGSLIVGSLDKNVRINLAMQLNGPVGGRQFVIIGSASDLTINGQLSGTTGVNLTKQGFGTLVLTADNSGFTGPITLDTNGGIVRITNALALGDNGGPTTVQANAQIQVSNVKGAVPEDLILNGPGPAADGALQNFQGNNVWAGDIALDSDTTFGSVAGSLLITGTISDLGPGHNVTKEGAATVIFGSADTYRGSTTVNNGTLDIRDPLALGPANLDGGGNVLVNQSIGKAGTLEIEDPTGVGFSVAAKQLTLNGFGVQGTGLIDSTNGIGALYNLNGSNVWTGNVVLCSAAPNTQSPAIGVQQTTTLTVTGIVSSQPNAARPLTVNPDPVGLFATNQPDSGTLIFTSANTYVAGVPIFLPPSLPAPAVGTIYRNAGTIVNDGIFQIQDSAAAGTGAIYVRNGGSLALAVDDIPDSVTSTTNTLVVNNGLIICGYGASVLGAVVNISGVNTYRGTVTLADPENSTNIASIGVQPDPNPTSNNSYFPAYSAQGNAISGDYSLTIFGAINGSFDYTSQGGFLLKKYGDGQLILPNANNGLTSPLDIVQGWVTARNSNSLGATIAGLDQNLQPVTAVEVGAALHLDPANGSLDVNENLVLKGQGISHPFGLINQQGALENLAGFNQVHGNVQLQGAAGVGVETVFNPALQANATSQLNIGSTADPLQGGGEISDAPTVFNVAQRSDGSPNENDYVIDTGGTQGGTITLSYNMYAAPGNSIDVFQGINNQGGNRIGGTGVPVSGANTITIKYGPGSSLIEFIVNLNGSPLPRTQWYYLASIAPNVPANGGITKTGSRLLSIQDDGTYTGPVDVRQGVLVDQNNTGLGIATSTSTVTVEPGATLALASGIGFLNGGVTSGIQVGYQHLVLNGPGDTFLLSGPGITPTNVPLGSLTVLKGNDLTGGTDTIAPSDDLWRGPVTLNSSATIDVQTNTRLILAGAIDDGPNPLAAGSDLVKVDGGELVLSGNNSYRGTTYVGAGATGDPNVGALQQVQVYGTAGTFALSFTFGGNTDTTPPLPLGDSADDVRAALNKLSTIGGVGGSVTVTQTGSFYAVQFGGSLAGLSLPALVPTTTGGTLAAVTIENDGGKLSAYFGHPGAEPGGVLTAANGKALGSTAGGTVVQGGSSLQTQGNITIAGEPLVTQGQGLGATPSPAPATWFQQGPVAVQNGPTLGKDAPVSGRITGVAVDPADLQTIYVSTAGGGAWKTSNGGKTWLALFDQQTDAQSNPLPLFGGAIAVDPTNPLVVYYGSGEANNSPDSYYGSGVYKSTDGGRTWNALTGYTTIGRGTPVFDGATPPNVIAVNRPAPVHHAGNPFDGMAISSITIDASHPQIIFVAASDRATNSPVYGQGGSGNLIQKSGIWRYCPTPDGNGYRSDWYDMTAAVSDQRYGLVVVGGDSYPKNPDGSVNFPAAAGPDDWWYQFQNGAIVWTLNFPTTGVYSDVAITDMRSAALFDVGPGNLDYLPAFPHIPGHNSGGVLYMSYGEPFELDPVTGKIDPNGINNAVYRCDMPDNIYGVLPSAGGVQTSTLDLEQAGQDSFYFPAWYIGDGNSYPLHNNYQAGGSNHYPTLIPGTQANGNTPTWRNGSIKLAATFLPPPPSALEPVPYRPPFDIQSVLFDTVVYGVNPDIDGFQGGNETLTTSNGVLDVQRTIDGGQNWRATQALPPNVARVPDGTPVNVLGNQGFYSNKALLSPDGQTFYFGGEWGIAYTQDGGTTWLSITRDAAGNAPAKDIHALTFIVDPNVTSADFPLGTPIEMLAGTDGGLWVYDLRAGTATSNQWADLNSNLGVAQLNGLSTVPGNPNVLVVGNRAAGIDLYTGGQTWKMLNTASGLGAVQAVTANLSTYGGRVAIDPNNPSVIYAWVNTSEIGWQGISPVDFPFPGFEVFGQPADANSSPNPSETQVATLLKSTDGGATWFSATIPTNEPPTNPQVWTFGDDGDQEFENSPLPDGSLAYLQSPPLLLDNVNTQRVLVGTDYSAGTGLTINSKPFGGVGGIFGNLLAQSLGGAQSPWFTLSNLIQFPPGTINLAVTGMAVAAYQGPFRADPDFPLVFDIGANSYDANTVYVTNGVNVFVSKNLGTSWVQRDPGTSLISDVEVDPRDRDFAYVTSSAAPGSKVPRVMMSTTAGRTIPGQNGQPTLPGWVDLTGSGKTALPDVPVWKLVLDPRNGYLYAATDDGVYFSTGGASWQRLGAGMANVRVTDMVLDQSINTLSVATYGRGQYTIYLDLTTASAGGLNAISGTGVWTGPVALSGPTNVGAAGVQPPQIGSQAASLNIIGTISDLIPGANNPLNKVGFGDVIFSGANTYGGTTEVQQGALVVHNPLALGATGVAEVQTIALTGVPPGANLVLTFGTASATVPISGTPADAQNIQDALNGLSSVQRLGGQITVTQTGPGMFSVRFGGYMTGFQQQLLQATVTSGSVLVGEAVIGAGGTVVDPGQVLQLQSDLQGEPVQLFNDGVVFNGHNTGSLRNVSNNNTFTGTLILKSNVTVGVDSGSQLTIAAPGAIVDNGNKFKLTKELTGTLVLDEPNSYGTGSPASASTFVAQGALNVQDPGALGVPNNLTEVLDGAQIQLQGGVTMPADQSLRLSGTGINNTGALEGTGGGPNAWEGPITLARDPGVLIGTSPPLQVSSPPTTVAIGALMTNPADTLTIDGVISDAPGLSMGLIKVDAGTVVLTNANTYGGQTTVAQGALRITNGAALGSGVGAGGPPTVALAAGNNGGQGYTGLSYGQTQQATPPDTNGAAGPSSYVETVNQTVALFANKATGGGEITADLGTFFGGLPAVGIFSDPVVAYDDNIQGGGRFIVVDQNISPGAGLALLDIAVSKSSTPGSLSSTDWYFFQIDNHEAGAPNLWADYPGNLGYNADALVVTFNMFTPGETFRHSQIVSVDINALINGTPLTVGTNAFIQDRNGFGYRPTVMHDAQSGDPMWLVRSGNGSNIIVTRMTNVLSSASTFTNTTLTVNAYSDIGTSPPLNPDGSVITDDIDSRMQKAAEWNNTLVATHAVSISPTQDVAQWYQIDVSTGTPRLADQGDINQGANTYVFYPSIDINAQGQIGMTFMQSGTDSPTDFMSMYVTGRTPADTPGTMQTPLLVPLGTGLDNYFQDPNVFPQMRAGDLSGINVDPVDGTFWAANEFANTDADANWGTAIVNFTFLSAAGARNGAVVQAGAALELDGDPAGTGANITVPSTVLTLNGTGAPDVQTVTVNGSAGSFTLTFNGQTTGALAFNATAGQVQAALNALASVKGPGGAVQVALEATAAGNVYTVVFGGKLTPSDQPQMTAKGTGGTTAVVSTYRHGATGALRNYIGNNTYAAPIVLQTDSAVGADPGTTLTVPGQVQDENPASVPAPTLTKVGAGAVVLAVGNSYTGPTVVNQGILNVQDKGALGASVSEQQQVTLSGPLTGFFSLTFVYNGVSGTTPKLSSDTTNPSFPTLVTNALNNLASVKNFGGSVTVTMTGGSAFKVTFGGGLANTNLPPMQGAGFNGTQIKIVTLRDGSSGTVVNAGGTLQLSNDVTVTGEPLAITGSGTSAVQQFTPAADFTLTFNNQTTPALPFGSGADAVMAALNALPSVGGVGGSVFVELSNGVYSVVFGGTLAGKALPTMTGTGLGPVVTVVDNPDFSQTFSLLGGPGGGFTLTFNGNTTTPLQFGASAAQVQAALDALDSILGVGGSVTVTQNGNASYTVVFGDDLAGADQPLLSGTGVVFTVTAGGLGALDSPSGNNTWDSSLTLAGNASVGADIDSTSGTPVVSTLTIDKTINESVAGSQLTKVGPGNVVLSGTTDNTFTGLTTVADGTLELNKTPGKVAIGNVTVGDGSPDDPLPAFLSDVLLFLAPDQMPAASAVTVDPDGLFDLNGQSQTIGSLTMTGGTVSLTGPTATLALTGDVTASTDSFGDPATIQDLGTLDLGSGAHTFNVKGPVGFYADLVISAHVNGTAAAALSKSGAGTLALAADNTFAGLATVSQGTLIADGDPVNPDPITNSTQTLGPVSLAGGTLAGNGAVGTVTSAPVGGTVTGGDPFPIPPGTLTINTTVDSPTTVLNPATNFFVVLNAAGSGQPSSQLVVNGPDGFGGDVLDLGGAVLTGLVDRNIQVGDTFTIITTTNGTINLNDHFLEKFSPDTVFIDGLKFTVQYTSNSVVLTRTLENATVGLTSSSNPSVFGELPKFTATVTPEPGAGTVPDGDLVTFTISQGGVPIFQQDVPTVNGKAVLDPSIFGFTFQVGTYAVDATYNEAGGDPFFNSPSAPTVTQVVNKALTTITMSSTPSNNPNPIPNQPVTVTATVVPVAPGAGVPQGSVTFTLDGNAVPGSYTLVNGQASVVLNGLTASLHRVRASFTDSDGNFQDFTSTDDFLINVVKGNPTVTVTPSLPSSVFGQTVAFTATLGGVAGLTPSGNVDFYADGISQANRLGGGALFGGVFTVSTSGLSVGTHTIIVTYGGDASYNSAQGTLSNYQVSASPTTTSLTTSVNPSTYSQTVTFTAVVSPSGGGAGTPTGLVNFYDGNTLLGGSIITAAGSAQLLINSLTIGAHNITATYVGNVNFATSTSSPPLVQVVKSGSVITITSSSNPSVFGQSVTFSAKVKAPNPLTNVPPDGETVEFFIDGVDQGPATLAGGVATFTTSTLSRGNAAHIIEVDYAGDAIFQPSTNTFNQTVNRAATTTAVSLSAASLPLVYGQAVTLTASVAAKAPGAGTPTGNVNFYADVVSNANLIAGNVPLDGSGTAVVTVPSRLTPGKHTFLAVYADDNNFMPSQGGSTAQQINQAASVTTITSGPSPSVYGQPVTLSAQVVAGAPGSGNPGGKVTFWDGLPNVGTNLGAGTLTLVGGVPTATLTVTTLGAATHTLHASYAGDANFAAGNTTATGPATQVVNKDTTTAALSSSANPSVKNQSVTFTAVVTADAPGGGTPGGTVTFTDNGSPIGSANLIAGKATLVISTLAPVPATHSVQAHYQGSANYVGGDSNSVPQAVLYDDTVTVKTSLTPSTYGQQVTFTVTVTPVGITQTPTGFVHVFDGGTDISGAVALAGGKATFPYSLLTAGTHNITASYDDANAFFINKKTAQPLKQAVNKDGSVATVSASTPLGGNNSIYGLAVTLTATISPKFPHSPGVPGGSVVFWDGAVSTGKRLGTAALSGGLATLTVTTLSAGKTPVAHAINVSYAGDVNYTASNSSVAAKVTVAQSHTQTTISSSPGSTVYGEAVTFTAVVTPTDGGGVPAGSVAFIEGGTTLGTATLDATGTAKLVLTTQLDVGTHNVTATYQGNTNYVASSSAGPTSVTVGQADTTVSLASSVNPSGFLQPVTLTASITAVAPGSGTPTGQVTFMDGGVTLGTATVSGGKATLVVSNLSIGDHAITASYTGDKHFIGHNGGPLTQTVKQQFVAALVVALPNLPKSGVAAGTPFVMMVTAVDSSNNRVWADFDPVTVKVVQVPTNGKVSGTLTGVSFKNGLATFSGLTVNRFGTYKLHITASGFAADLTFTVSTGRQS